MEFSCVSFLNLLLEFCDEFLMGTVVFESDVERFKLERVKVFTMLPVGRSFNDVVVPVDFGRNGAVVRCDLFNSADDTPIVGVCVEVDVFM